MSGRPLPPLELGWDERLKLAEWACDRRHSSALARRARAILACAQGKSNTSAAAESGLSMLSVGKWRKRFLTRGLEGLFRKKHAHQVSRD